MKLFKKVGAFICRALLGLIQSTDGKLNYIKIGLLFGTFGLYSLLLSWKFAILLMVGIGWHESGHVWAMRRVGVSTRGFYFIPFMGGVAISDGEYKSSRDKVIVFIMGPIWGMLLAFATWIAYLITDNPFLGVAAYWQALLNLFNLMPVNPLDGGQICRAVLTSINKTLADVFAAISVAIFVLCFAYLKSPVFLFAAYLAGRDFWTHFKYPVDSDIPVLSRRDIIATGGSYLVLCGILILIFICTSPIGASLNTILK
jgi:Zn-dependent protease